jgi:hypothetical protein
VYIFNGLLWLGLAHKTSAASRDFIPSKAFCISGVHLNGGALTPFLGAPVLAVSGDKMWDL